MQYGYEAEEDQDNLQPPPGDEDDPRDHSKAFRKPSAKVAERWPDLLLLEEYLEPVLLMEHDMMPEALGDWVSDIATRLHCSLDYAAVTAVVATGSAIASRVRMRPLHYKSWQIAPNLWGGIIGEPGTKKSPHDGRSLQSAGPFEDWRGSSI